MKSKRIIYFVLVIFILVIVGVMIGKKPDIQTKTSLILSSDDIAIVNNDQTVDYNDSTLNFGEEIVKQIEHEDTNYNYGVTNSATAMQGLSDGRYVATITIPSNLTNSILTINTEAPIKAGIDYELESNIPSSKSKDIENEIQSLLFGFESKLSYMYIYAIFDSLHTTQEGVETVTENQQPVYEFLEQVSEIDIVANHEYELEENNTDSFENVDISKQMQMLSEIITNYNTDITDVIKIYKVENDEYNQQVNTQIEVFEQNTQEIIKRIENIEDTLDTLVDVNKQYADEDYSVTDSKDDIQSIMVKYYNQLSELNTINSDNQKLVEDADEMKTQVSDLRKQSVYKFIIKLLAERQNYYLAVDGINDCVQGKNESGAKLCLAGKKKNFETSYSNYENLISEFKNEASYYKTLSYYINHIGEDITASEEETTGTNSYQADIVGNTQSFMTESEDLTPSVRVTKYNNPLNNHFYFSIHVDNRISKQTNLSIDYSLENGESVTLLTNDDNVSITKSQIKINNLKPITNDYLFMVKTIDDTAQSAITITDDISIDTIENSSSLFNIELNKNDDNNLQLVYEYNGEDSIELESQLFSHVTNITSDNDEIISLDNTTLTINTDSLESESIVTIDMQLDTSALDDGDYQIDYTINGNNGVEVYTINQLTLNSSEDESDYTPNLKISDDAYVAVDGKLDDVDDDYESINVNGIGDYIKNNTVEPGETVGIEVSLPFVKTNPNLDTISFDLSNDLQIFEELTFVGMKTGYSDYITADDVDITDGIVTISNVNFISEDVVESELEGGSDYYKFDISIYLNAKVREDSIDEVFNFKDTDTFGYLSNIEVNNKFIYNNTYSSDEYDFAFGDPELTDVTYQVDSDICNSSIKKLGDCAFEGGEEITRTITITNEDRRNVASGLVFSENLNTDLLSYNSETSYTISSNSNKDISGAADLYINDYQNAEVTEGSSKRYELTIPADSTVTISTKLLVSEEITTSDTITVTQSLEQYNNQIFSADQALRVKPISLIVTDVSGEQIVDDGIITDDEALKITFEIKNDSNRGTSHRQNIVINNSNNAITEAEVMSIENEEWEDVSPSMTNGTNQYQIETNYDLKPDQSLAYTVKYRFGKVPNISDSQHLIISTYKTDVSEAEDAKLNNNYEYYFSSKSYLELAQDQLANKEVVTSNTYDQTLESNTQTTEDLGIIDGVLQSLNSYVFNFIEYITTIDNYTILENDGISNIIASLNEDGLTIDTDETEVSVFDYCLENNELSCNIYSLYKKIFEKELKATEHIDQVLNTIDPNIEYKQSSKQDSNKQTTNDPTNIGADFNGYGNCKVDNKTELSEAESVDEDEPFADCEKTEVGIWQRFDQQDEDINTLKDDIEQLINNELKEVDEEPYQEEVTENNSNMNESMAEVEMENNELFNKKIEVYNENYDHIMDYVQDISEDKSYTKKIKQFTDEENTRQIVTMEILGNVFNLMPNTYLDGMPNRLVYSFIANPVSIEEVDGKETEETPVVVEESNKMYVYGVIGLCVLSALLIGIYLYINREVY